MAVDRSTGHVVLFGAGSTASPAARPGSALITDPYAYVDANLSGFPTILEDAGTMM